MPDAEDAGESRLAATQRDLKSGGLRHRRGPLEGKEHHSAIPAEREPAPAGTSGWAKTVTAITAPLGTLLILAVPSK